MTVSKEAGRCSFSKDEAEGRVMLLEAGSPLVLFSVWPRIVSFEALEDLAPVTGSANPGQGRSFSEALWQG